MFASARPFEDPDALSQLFVSHLTRTATSLACKLNGSEIYKGFCI
jgi:hypothetical protein